MRNQIAKFYFSSKNCTDVTLNVIFTFRTFDLKAHPLLLISQKMQFETKF